MILQDFGNPCAMQDVERIKTSIKIPIGDSDWGHSTWYDCTYKELANLIYLQAYSHSV